MINRYFISIVSMVLLLFTSGCDQSDATQKPFDQVQFENIRIFAWQAYVSAPNDIVKSKIYNKAKSDTQAWLGQHGLTFKNWSGRIKRINTSHGGGTVDLYIQSNGHNYFSLNIPSTDTIYDRIARTKEGEKIYFSGVLPKNGEGSFTEKGSLENPDFSVKFTSITQ